MFRWVSREAVRTARTVVLYDFLLAVHPADVIREGLSLRLRSDHSVCVKSGYVGYKDFSSGESGNSVECLTRFLGYSFPAAVSALCRFVGVDPSSTERPPASVPVQPSAPSPVSFVLPEPVPGSFRQLFAYLTRQRGIPADVVQQVVGWRMLYQELSHNNMVFVDPSRTFAELHGVLSSRPFHQVLFSDPASFWWFKAHGPRSDATVAYVCEAAIDALSLYVLQRAAGFPDGSNGLYCSIGGVANQQRIDRIKAGMASRGRPTVIAVDRDAAGDKCRQDNADCAALVPSLKDWNDVLVAGGPFP